MDNSEQVFWISYIIEILYAVLMAGCLWRLNRYWKSWKQRIARNDQLVNWQLEEYEHRMRSLGKVPSPYGYDAPSPDTVVAPYTGYRVDRNERW
jgi:hypothetical protein